MCIIVSIIIAKFCQKKLGIELERVGSSDDPFEGSNVTLICSTCNEFGSKYHPLETDELIEQPIKGPIHFCFHLNKKNYLNKCDRRCRNRDGK